MIQRLAAICLMMGALTFAADVPSSAPLDVITPGENLVVEGIPAIPTSLADAVGRYTEFRAALFESWHPTRREMLIATRFADVAQVHQVKMPGGARSQLTFFKEPARSPSYRPKNGDFFVFSKDIGGNEFFQLFRYDLATGDITLLTDGKSRNTDPVWSENGSLLAYGSTRRNGKDVDLYVMDPRDAKTDLRVAQLEGGGWTVEDFSPDARELLVGEYVSINESYLWLVDVSTGAKKLITPRGGVEKVAYEHAVFARDGKGFYATTDRESEFQRLAYVDLNTFHHDYLSNHIKWDVEEVALSHDGKTVAFVTNEEGISRLHLLDTSSQKEKPLSQLAGSGSPQPATLAPGSITGLQWHANDVDLGFSLISARATADAYSIDTRTGTIDRWTTSETGGINPENFSEPQLIRWQSFDGKTISGFLYRPPKKFTGKRPVIIEIHGGPEAQFRPGPLGRDNYLVNELGCAILCPNIRGSAGYGKTFLKLDNTFLREDAYKDIGSLLDWVGRQPQLDGSRIMVTGGSYGGHMTFAVASLYSDRIRCAMPVVGMSNLVSFLEHTESYRRDLRRAEYGDERDPKMREFLLRIAPLNNAEKIKVPLFVVQGGNDPRVPASEARQMVEKVKANGSPVWLLLAKDEGHGFAKKKNRDFQFYATVLFVQKYLLQ
jgi:dipeptidyl aminopeptidase/acylaminoacyl peptidase